MVRPLRQTVVPHRLLGRLVGASWLRWSLELLTLPVVPGSEPAGRPRRRTAQSVNRIGGPAGAAHDPISALRLGTRHWCGRRVGPNGRPDGTGRPNAWAEWFAP